MKIGLIYLGRHGPGGAISLHLAECLAKRADVFAVVSRNGEYFDSWRRSKMPLIEVPTFDGMFDAFTSCLNQAHISAIASRIRSQSPDVLLYAMVHPWTPFLQSRLQDIPDVVTVHDPFPHPGILHRLSSLWEGRAARRATRCVILSSTFLTAMERRGVAREKIDVIPHGVMGEFGDGHRILELQNSVSVPEFVHDSLLFFGRITKYKGLDVLLRAYRNLAQRWPDLRLRIVGEGNLRPYASLLRGLPRTEVINRWVLDAEIAGLFQAAGIVVLPYLSASQSGVVAIAAAFARPVVATKVGALAEQIEHGQTGLLIDPGSIEQLEEAVETLVRQPELGCRLGKELAARNQENNNWDKVAQAYADSCGRAVCKQTRTS